MRCSNCTCFGLKGLRPAKIAKNRRFSWKVAFWTGKFPISEPRFSAFSANLSQSFVNISETTVSISKMMTSLDLSLQGLQNFPILDLDLVLAIPRGRGACIKLALERGSGWCGVEFRNRRESSWCAVHLLSFSSTAGIACGCSCKSVLLKFQPSAFGVKCQSVASWANAV